MTPTKSDALAMLRSRDAQLEAQARRIRQLERANARLLEITRGGEGLKVIDAALAIYTNKQHGIAMEADEYDPISDYWILRDCWRDVRVFRATCARLLAARAKRKELHG